MWVVLYRTRGKSWCAIKRAKTKSGAMSQMRAHHKRFSFGLFGVMMGDEYKIEQE